jgi:ribosome-binding protein aMBF1 (putative translation factor)
MEQERDLAGEDGWELRDVHERHGAEQREAAPQVGAVLNMARETMGLSVAQVAEHVDIDPEDLERIERIESGEQVTPKALQDTLTKALVWWLAETPV